MKICWNIEVWAVQKHVNLVDLVKSFPTNIYLQNLTSIQPRTSLSKFLWFSHIYPAQRFNFHIGTTPRERRKDKEDIEVGPDGVETIEVGPEGVPTIEVGPDGVPILRRWFKQLWRNTRVLSCLLAKHRDEHTRATSGMARSILVAEFHLVSRSLSWLRTQTVLVRMTSSWSRWIISTYGISFYLENHAECSWQLFRANKLLQSTSKH